MRRGQTGTGEIQLTIERLSLYGFAPAEGPRVVRALEAELTRLAGGMEPDIAARAVEARGPVHYAPSHDPEHTGRAAARALWSRLTGSERETS